ncbi:MAG: hypothetical protein JNL10_20925 [Verrucomicrobiales bacterium]|nr:hypothetical protein [Verrucomicrobiales bacterium]
MKLTPLPLAALLAITGLSTFAASIEARWIPSTPPEEIAPTTGDSPGKRHARSLVESNGSRNRRTDISLFWQVSDDQIHELEMSGILDLLKLHINPDYNFQNVTQEQLDRDLQYINDILAGSTGGTAPEPGPTALVAGGFLAVLWVVRRRITQRRQPGANPAP